jgi:hypothetical protein
MSSFKTHFVICDCNDPHHHVVYQYDDESGEVYVNHHLNVNWPWHRRLWYAIRYVFGYKSPYGMYDGMIINAQASKELGLWLVNNVKNRVK